RVQVLLSPWRRKETRRVCTEPEERRVPHRDDARVAEYEIQRQREERHHEHLASQHQVLRKQEPAREREQPEGDLGRAPAILRDQARLPKRPAGNAISSATISR